MKASEYKILVNSLDDNEEVPFSYSNPDDWLAQRILDRTRNITAPIPMPEGYLIGRKCFILEEVRELLWQEKAAGNKFLTPKILKLQQEFSDINKTLVEEHQCEIKGINAVEELISESGLERINNYR